MNKMEENWLDVLLPYRNHTLVLGCSGGIDSMVLLHFLGSHGFSFEVVHINYHQRGEESDADEALVKEYCENTGVTCHIFHYPSNSNKKGAGNFQERARDFRYTRFQEVLTRLEPSKLVLAHHADDQVETFFLNLARKGGIMGLSGMTADSEKAVRPLIHTWKHDLYQYAVQHDVRWRNDASNAEVKYSRNRIRNQWIPLLEDEVPGIKSSVLLLTRVFQENQQLLEDKARLLVKHIRTTGRLELGQLQALDRYLLFEVWRQLGQDAASYERFASIFGAQKGKFVELNPPYARVIREDDHFYFEPTLQSFELPVLTIESVDQLPGHFNKDCLYLDGDKVNGTLSLRVWQIGDRIAPAGMSGTQLVSDIISDAHIAHHQRDKVLVVTDDTTVHWVIGLKVGRLALANPKSKQILQISIN